MTIAENEEFQIHKYVHGGIRQNDGKKLSILYKLEDDNSISLIGKFSAGKNEESLIGLIFNGEFSENKAILEREVGKNIGSYRVIDAEVVSTWYALQNQALAELKKKSIKPDILNDLLERIKPERKAYQQALRVRNYPQAEAIKNLIEIALTQPLNKSENSK